MQSDTEPLTGAERARFWTVADGGGTDLLSARYLTHSFNRHTHPAYTVAVITAGAEQYRYRGVRHRVTPGQVATQNPDEPHDGCRAAEEGWCYQAMYLPIEAFAVLAPDQPNRPFFPETVLTDSELAARFATQHRAFSGPPSLARDEGFLELLALLAGRHGRVSPPHRIGRVSGPVARVRAYLDAHAAETVPLARLSVLAGLPPLSLVRAFSRSVGMPPHAYQTARRVARAETLLRQGLMPADVALECGFADQSHLTRAFKRIVGVPPGHYRLGTFKTGRSSAP